MDHHSQSNGLESFLEHWSILVVGLIVIGTLEITGLFERMGGTARLCFLIASIGLLLVGSGLVGYAKVPAHRSGPLFAFGAKSVSEGFVGYYRWGWRLFLLGAALGFFLLLSTYGRG
jgi:hypothetical protein